MSYAPHRSPAGPQDPASRARAGHTVSPVFQKPPTDARCAGAGACSRGSVLLSIRAIRTETDHSARTRISVTNKCMVFVCVFISGLINGPLFIKVSFKAREIKTTYFNTTHMALFKLLIFLFFFTFYTRNVIKLLMFSNQNLHVHY